MNVCSICSSLVQDERKHADWHRGPRTGEAGLDRLVAASLARMTRAGCDDCGGIGVVEGDPGIYIDCHCKGLTR